MLNLDIGLEIDHPDFQDVYLPREVMDLINFDIIANLFIGLSIGVVLTIGEQDLRLEPQHSRVPNFRIPCILFCRICNVYIR